MKIQSSLLLDTSSHSHTLTIFWAPTLTNSYLTIRNKSFCQLFITMCFTLCSQLSFGEKKMFLCWQMHFQIFLFHRMNFEHDIEISRTSFQWYAVLLCYEMKWSMSLCAWGLCGGCQKIIKILLSILCFMHSHEC